MSGAVKPTTADIEWLRAVYPSIYYEEKGYRLLGELDIRACYDATEDKLRAEGSLPDEQVRRADNFIQDVFEVEIRLNAEAIGTNGWPRVYEIGGRVEFIAQKWNVPKVDLHVFEDDSFCVGLKYVRPRRFILRWFVRDRVVPFLYRLAYVDRFGVEAARKDLWGEYSHGEAGYDEYEKELAGYARRATGRNDPCPCGSDKKAKKCCLDEIQEWMRRTAARESAASSISGGNVPA